MMRPIIALVATVAFAHSVAAAEPKTCSQAYEACRAHACDAGCQATCRLRFNGCLTTGAFSLSAPRTLLQNLKRY